jgi:hypothetical protein
MRIKIMTELIDANATMKMIEEAKVKSENSRTFAENIIRFSKPVLIIPENPTNGDMIMALFPNASLTEHEGGATIAVAHTYKFNSTWWNSPYNRETEVDPNNEIDDISEVTDYSAYPVSEPHKEIENEETI